MALEAAQNPAVLDQFHSRNTYSVVSPMAYLLGVPRRIFELEAEPPKLEVYETLDRQKHARIVRNLSILRTAMVRFYRVISQQMTREYRGLMGIGEIPRESIDRLAADGVDILRAKHTLNDYLVDVNRLISDRINNCKALFPIWLSWPYVREAFLMPQGLTPAGIRQAAGFYNSHRNCYPYQVYLNWPAEEQGNILYNDRKFVTLLYQWNGDEFEDLSKVSDAGSYTKGSIRDFLDGSGKTVVVVDCENSDPYKLCATLRGLDPLALDKISKIILYDDVHAASAWGILNTYIHVPVEHVRIERIKQNKSLVDIKLTAGTCHEYYKNHVDSFVLVSSDSDYWGLISSLPEARFLVMVEHEKCGPAIKAALAESGIFYCYIDDFYSGETNDIKINALLQEMYRYLDQAFRLNVNDMLEFACQTTRAGLSEAEKEQFYNRFIKPMHLEIEKDGNVSIRLKAR